MSKKIKPVKSPIKETPYEKMKMNRKDWLILLIMMAVYSVIAFIRLGTFNTPQTWWRSSYARDYFVVDLGEEKEISRINCFYGFYKGSTTVYYLDEETGEYVELMVLDNYEDNDAANFFKVVSTQVDEDDPAASVTARYLKFQTKKTGSAIYEIGIFEKGSQEPIRDIEIIENETVEREGYGVVENLFDEPDCIPYSYDVMNSTYFDEIYHGRTGYEHLNGIRPYEWTHPPLGKLLITVGMWLFGANMFGMRFMGTFFGVLMIGVMYMFGKKLTKNTFGGFAAAFLMMFDFMHFTHSRIASIDVYAVFFTILMFYFMYDYYVYKAYNMGMKKSLTALFLSGLFMGCAISVKWNTAYGALGLAILFFAGLVSQWNDYRKLEKNRLLKNYQWTNEFQSHYVVRTIVFCFIAFIAVPVTLYFTTFVPYLLVKTDGAYTVKGIMDLQISMYNYHSGLKATHSFSSPWYSWPFIGRPLYMYASADNVNGMRGTIVTMGNPAIWWGGIVGVFASIAIAYRKKDRRIVPIVVALLSLYLPWVLVSRCTFIYHYFPVLPFVMLCTVYALNELRQRYRWGKYVIIAYFVLIVLLFIMFYPALTGLRVSSSYINNWLRWFPSWAF